MLEVQKPNKKTIFYLKSLLPKNGDYKNSACILCSRYENGFLLHHTFTKQLLFLTEEEFNSFYSSEYSKEFFYSIPSETDETALVDIVRELMFPTVNHFQENKKTLQYLIFTTTCCNARCPYCYEIGHHKNTTMSIDTAERAAKFILDNSPLEQEIVLSWMGGEPLLNTRVIDLICKRLSDAGRQFTSKLTTNAYLLNSVVINMAKENWNIKKIQFTLDGTEKVYNQIKGFVGVSDSHESPFQVVIRNMKAAMDIGLNVELHLNTSEENCADILNLVHFLHDYFGKRERFSIKVNTLIERNSETSFRRSKEQEEYLYDYVDKIIRACREYGYMEIPNLDKVFRLSHCNAYRNEQITILTDGHLGMCDQVLDGHFIGSVDSIDFDQNEIAYYKTHMAKLEECNSCPLYPDCIRLNCCLVDVPWCSETVRQVRQKRINESMVKCYTAFMDKERDRSFI